MDDGTKKFNVWLFRERYWQEGGKGRKVAGPFDEPAEAADAAEQWLIGQGLENQSYCEIRLNGSEKPHTVICYMSAYEFGIWNTDAAKWPIFYTPEGSYLMLGDFPFQEADDGNAWRQQDNADKAQESDEGDMRLDEIEDDERKEEDGRDEAPEDDEVQEDDFTEDEDSDDEAFEADEEGQDEGAEEDDNSDDQDDDGEAEEDSDEEDLDDGDDETEVEMPRLGIFAKFRGPKGWRKRAEAESENARNVFGLKLGILNPDGEKASDQEHETFAEFQFIESESERDAGLLRIKLPQGVEFSAPTKAGWITARIPYRQED